MASFTAQHNLVKRPSTFYNYSSGSTNLLMAALRNALPEGVYDDYPWQTLFEPLGMQSVVWERDQAGTFVGSSYVYMTARDLAKLGYLFLHDGVWDGQRILAEGWVNYTLTPAPASYYHPLIERIGLSVGAQWYINRSDASKGIPKAYPNLPDDLFYASGHWGKKLYVIPSKGLMIVRLGDDREYGCDADGGRFCVEDYKTAFSEWYFLESVVASVEGTE